VKTIEPVTLQILVTYYHLAARLALDQRTMRADHLSG